MSDYPTGLTATAMNGGALLEWDMAAKNSMYVVYMSSSPEGGRIPIGMTTDRHFCLGALTPGGLYWWRVQVMGDERSSLPLFFTPPANTTAVKKPARPIKKIAMKVSNV